MAFPPQAPGSKSRTLFTLEKVPAQGVALCKTTGTFRVGPAALNIPDWLRRPHHYSTLLKGKNQKYKQNSTQQNSWTVSCFGWEVGQKDAWTGDSHAGDHTF